MREYIFDIAPSPAPRMSRQDKFKPSDRVLRYKAFREELTLEANVQGLKELPAAMGFSFEIAMPESWSKKKKALHIGQIHQQKPDLDNLIKAVKDSLTYRREADDSHVATYLFAQKSWAEKGSIRLYAVEEHQDWSGVLMSIKNTIRGLW